MQRMADLEAELATFERQARRSVTEEQRQQILQLGRDFPRLWKAKTTSTCDRKRMLRLLIRDVTVVKGPEPKLLRLQICWQGGATEVLEVRQRPKRQDAIRYPDAFVAKIRDMAKIYNNREIVGLLNGEGLISSTGKPFTLEMIRWIRHKHHIPGPLPPDGTLTVGQVRQSMASAYGSSITGLHVVSSQQCNPNRTRPMLSRSILMLISACENGLPILAISIGSSPTHAE